MFDNSYFPVLNIRPAEMEAYGHLPGPDKDLMLPLVGMKKWYSSNSLANSVAQIDKNIGDRKVILDLGPVGNGTGADQELIALSAPENDYANWIDYVSADERFVPTLQIANPEFSGINQQARELCDLGRGVVLRVRRENGWSAGIFTHLSDVDFGGSEVMVVYDLGQIVPREDIGLLAAMVSAQSSVAADRLGSATLTHCVVGSSFPSEFTSIDREHARIEIRERQLHAVLNGAVEHQGSGVRYAYGDHGSVFAGVRGFAQTGSARRVDYPSRLRWIYHRREELNASQLAAQAVMREPEWDEELAIWGVDCIRRAAGGDLAGLEHQRQWTAVCQPAPKIDPRSACNVDPPDAGVCRRPAA